MEALAAPDFVVIHKESNMSTYATQCDSCIFKLSESQAKLEDDIAIENKYKALRSLKNSPKKPRVVSVSIGAEKTEETDKTETCFIDSPLWPENAKTVHCPDRIDNCLSLESATALREARLANSLASSANRSARGAQIWAIIAAIVAAIAIAFPYMRKYLE